MTATLLRSAVRTQRGRSSADALSACWSSQRTRTMKFCQRWSFGVIILTITRGIIAPKHCTETWQHNIKGNYSQDNKLNHLNWFCRLILMNARFCKFTTHLQCDIRNIVIIKNRLIFYWLKWSLGHYLLVMRHKH